MMYNLRVNCYLGKFCISMVNLPNCSIVCAIFAVMHSALFHCQIFYFVGSKVTVKFVM